MILDQRHLHNVDTVSDVHAGWDEHLERVNAARAGKCLEPLERVDRHRELHAYAYVNCSRWVADCPACRGGAYTWPDHRRACCLDCFTVFAVSHPPKERIDIVVPILNERPDPDTRSWDRYDARGGNDPKQLETGRWFEDDARAVGDGWEATRRLRNENLIVLGLSGDGTGQQVVASPYAMGLRLGRDGTLLRLPDTAAVTVPDGAGPGRLLGPLRLTRDRRLVPAD